MPVKGSKPQATPQILPHCITSPCGIDHRERSADPLATIVGPHIDEPIARDSESLTRRRCSEKPVREGSGPMCGMSAGTCPSAAKCYGLTFNGFVFSNDDGQTA